MPRLTAEMWFVEEERLHILEKNAYLFCGGELNKIFDSYIKKK